MLRSLTVVLAIGLVGPVQASEAADVDWITLPRLQEVWRREGLLSRGGVAGPDAYYTLTDDGRAVVALDAATGRDRWRSELPAAKGQVMDLARLERGLVVARSSERGLEALHLGLSDGRLTWSRHLDCWDLGPQMYSAGSTAIVRCHRGRESSAFMALSSVDGSELGRGLLDGQEFTVADSGEICTADHKQLSCWRFQGKDLRRLWRRPLAAGHDGVLRTAGPFVVHLAESTEVFRLADGHRLLERKGGPLLDGTHQRLISLVRHVETVSFRSGLGFRFPLRPGEPQVPDGPYHVIEADQVSLLQPRDNEEFLLLLDERRGLQFVDRAGHDFDGAVADLALEHVDGVLHAYSLTRLAAPAWQLDDYRQTVAVLEHCRDPHDATSKLGRTRAGLERLEQAITVEKGRNQLAAIRAAAASGSPRYLAALRRALDKMPVDPKGDAEELLLRETVGAIAAVPMVRAAEILLDYWQAHQDRLAPAALRLDIRDEVMATVWRHSAERTWAACPERTFPVRAEGPLGTDGPGRPVFLDPEGRWAVLCQARHDDNGDGRLSANQYVPGGDLLRPYLILGAGAGAEVDDVVATDRDGRHVVITLGLCVYDVNTRTGRATALSQADGRRRSSAFNSQRPVAFMLDGSRLAYARSQGACSQVVIRDLDSSRERVIDLTGELGGFTFDGYRGLMIETAESASLVKWTPLRDREPKERLCEENVMADWFGQPAPKPYFRRQLWTLSGGPPTDAPHSQLDPGPSEGLKASKYGLVPASPAAPLELPAGPFRWQRLR